MNRTEKWKGKDSAFTLVELLVVIALIAILVSLLLTALGKSKDSSKRILCAGNLRQCGVALLLYADSYTRYPHQRNPSTGAPLTSAEENNVWTRMAFYVAAEWDEVVRLGVSSGYQVDPKHPTSSALRIFSCPNIGDVAQDFADSAGGDNHIFAMGYYYVGGIKKWNGLPDSISSPFSPEEGPNGTLLVDEIDQNPADPSGFTELAHPTQKHTPLGANHLFNDGHVSWIPWNDGKNMKKNANWAPEEFYTWRRTVDAP